MPPSLRKRVRVFGVVFAATLLGTVAAAALMNYVVDPYAVFGTAGISGLSVRKPRPEVMLSDIKLIVGTRARPNALILGNSRAEIGFDPAHPMIEAKGLRGYNAAIAGTALDDAADAFRLFTSESNVDLAIVGVDFLDFLYSPDDRSASLPPTGPGVHTSPARTRLLALFSVTSVLDSIRTLLIQRQENPAMVLSNGFNPMLDYREIAANEGYPALFRQRAQESALNLARKPHNLYVGGQKDSPSLSALQAILRIAGEKKTELRLVIYPFHLLLLLQIQEAGLWPLFEQWKADVAALSDDARRRGVRVSLWDFSCPDRFTTEPIPASGDRKTKMQWYWEAGHFKKELGDRVLERMLGKAQTNETDDFGIELTTANVADQNDSCRRALATMRQRYPELAREAAELARSASPR